MLEPSSPAGEPFENQGQGENTAPLDFEQVCISLVERGWKILPKKGSYPINKQGPRYVNLVDPRGNRKSIRVIDPALWEKLRIVESTRSRKKSNRKAQHRDSDKTSNHEPERSTDAAPISPPSTFSLIPESNPITPVAQHSEMQILPGPPVANEIVVNPPPPLENPPGGMEAKTEEPSLQEMSSRAPEPVAAKAAPEFQNSILQLGLDSVIKSLQSETLSPSDVLRKIQDWMLTSKNLTEYMDKLNEQQKVPVPPYTTEKDQLIMELQTMLKETEDRLAALIHSAREI